MTNMQAHVYAFMRGFLQDNDQLPPTHAIQKQFGWKSKNAAIEHLQALERKGFLERNAVGKYKFARTHPGYSTI
jgi:SOS-response transcriptional repressor LexA